MMQTKYPLHLVAILMLASVTVMSMGIAMKAYAQNVTQTADTAAGQATNMTNMTGVVSNTDENDDAGEVEEGPGEDEDEPGDVDSNDEED
jgi:hypothetical protein